MQPVPGGIGSVHIIEPDAKRRAELESKGNHWHDVVRGEAEGPSLPSLPLATPPGWEREDFEKLYRAAALDQGENLVEENTALAMPEGFILQECPQCHVGLVVAEPLDVCPYCNTPLTPGGLDSSGQAS